MIKEKTQRIGEANEVRGGSEEGEDEGKGIVR